MRKPYCSKNPFSLNVRSVIYSKGLQKRNKMSDITFLQEAFGSLPGDVIQSCYAKANGNIEEAMELLIAHTSQL